VWEDNKDIVELITKKSLPIIKRFTVPIPGNFKAHVKLLLPPNADLSGNTKYPMIVYV
jgi:dipeptidyl-peptidase-4